MRGFITESELGLADQEFPGIALFFDALVDKPKTFLDLVSQFEHWGIYESTVALRAESAGARV